MSSAEEASRNRNDRPAAENGEDSHPIQLQVIDRSTHFLPDIAASGYHMPPEVLGIPNANTEPQTQQNRRQSYLADVNSKSRRRSSLAIKRTKSKAAIAAAAKVVSGRGKAAKLRLNSSMFTLLTFQGMEVIFANTSLQTLVGVCSRTHFLFQTVNLASKAPIISLSSNSHSGMLIVAHQDGIIQTYKPVPTKPCEFGESSRDSVPRSAFGKFRWIDCLTIRAASIFYQGGETVCFSDRRNAQPGKLLDISSSSDNRLLIAHGKQLAVFEASPPEGRDRTNGGANDDSTSGDASLLWTTLLPSNVVTAKISGDGQALVVVLDAPNETGEYGALTFSRDTEDGSRNHKLPKPAKNISVGMLYRPGPFLQHSTTVKRISFRGLGREFSTNADDEGQGNDLLLTYCEKDSSNRIFNQNGWQQLMLWSAPPKSRADWIRGSSAFSLGDLESQKKIKSTRSNSRRPSGVSDADSSPGGRINAGLRNMRSMGTGAPTTSAGAWIAEITFRDAFPALRLSRLSYMKRGNDDSQPAHFESVAAILPAGSIIADSVLNADDMGLVVQGIWPAWNPWLSETTSPDSNDSLSSSAMQFLGLSSAPPPTSTFGDTYLGGSHTPPTELRVAASHPKTGHLVLMEFPLWGDEDFGAMELGSPIRSVLSLSDAHSSFYNHQQSGDQIEEQHPSASMDYESSKLFAKVEPKSNCISFLWRKPGSMSLYSPDWRDDEDIATIVEASETSTTELLHDMSIVPAPLALPSLYLPISSDSLAGDKIVALKWWSDDSFGGPPLLLAITKSTSFLLFEIAPPWCVTEPTMPNYDPFNELAHSDSLSINEMDGPIFGSSGEDERDLEYRRKDYTVKVTPHTDFGLGLRLESPMDGTLAVAGSFKKHPLNGGMLPAEKSGMIVLGDELLSVNGVVLENMTFDDIIATVRHVGTERGPGEALSLKFRPPPSGRSRGNSAALHESFNPRALGSGMNSESNSGFRKLSTPIESVRKPGKPPDFDDRSIASLLLERSEDAQQEFGRLIGVIRKGFPFAVTGKDFSHRFLILPWEKATGRSLPDRLRGAALIVLAIGNKLYVRRLDLPLEGRADDVRIVDLGDISLVDTKDNITSQAVEIRGIEHIKSSTEKLSFAISDSLGHVQIIFLDCGDEDPSTAAAITEFHVFGLGSDSIDFQIRSPSINLFATLPKREDRPSQTITIWSSRPDPSCRHFISDEAVKDEYFGKDYIPIKLKVESSDWNSSIQDFCFLSTGHLDTFPALVVFMKTEVIVYQRRGGSLKWQPMIRLTYPALPDSSLASSRVPSSEVLTSYMPQEAFPHLLPSLRASLSSYDERKAYVSDWHPESLLTHLFTDERGAKVAMKLHVRGILLWLSNWIDGSSVERLASLKSSPILVAPFDAAGGEYLLQSDMAHEENSQEGENASSLMGSLTSARTQKESTEDATRVKLQKLLEALESRGNLEKEIDTVGRSREFKLAMSSRPLKEEGANAFPSILRSLQTNELRALWALTQVSINPPKFRDLDFKAQLALMIFSIHAAIKRNPIEDFKERPLKTPLKRHLSSFHVKRKSFNFTNERSPNFPPQNASAGCVAALLSDYQGQLLESLRQPGKKMDWPSAREMRLSFWLRSEDSLREVCEEIGQSLYRESRDILKSAIFFLLAGKKRTLRNLAAADNTESGSKFYKFLSDFDFSSARGRSAAEKNAFSLLRKNKYDCAAAFFLLAEPPILKSAVETIASKMEDLDLAFLVARLMGKQILPGPQISFGGGMMGYGGNIFGGGGGYAGSGAKNDLSDCPKDDMAFQDWKPELTKAATELLLDRGLPKAYNDTCFTAVQLMWLGRYDEASHWLTGFLGSPDGLFPSFSFDKSPPLFDRVTSLGVKKSQEQTICTMNTFVNFVSGPLLLKMVKASKRTRLASVLLVSSSLSKLGFELPCIRLIMQNVHSNNFQKEDFGDSYKKGQPEKDANPRGDSQSSTFDKSKANSETGQLPSSIFDSYDMPQVKKKSPPPTDTMVSSIFDDFDIDPPNKPVSSSGQMNSSIFDDFDAVPKMQKKQSSIFDSFDADPKVQTRNMVLNGVMASSIFDSFDVPQLTKKSDIGSSTVLSGAPSASSEEKIKEPLRSPPLLWLEWSRQHLLDISARRLIRELVSIGNRFHGDTFEAHLTPDGKKKTSLIPSEASQILQFHCDGESLVGEVSICVQQVCGICNLEAKTVVDRAVQLLWSPHQCHRLCFVALLHLSLRQLDLAEDAVRSTAQALMGQCISISFLDDDLAHSRKSVSHVKTLHLRRIAANLSWQLELCLWFHRGGALPLSGTVLNEAICAVRIGLLIASWNQDFVCLETMLKQPPDCLVDNESGRQLWTSLKIISSSSLGERKQSGTGTPSGGWEFLVDCRRVEATELLRPRQTGCFIIRPHPEDHGVFSLSFKTNLIPEALDQQPETASGEHSETKPSQNTSHKSSSSKPVKRDDVVQHAIVRLSDSGFRCGSFGPFATLMKLLDAVSSSLPFDLRFDLPPNEGVVKDGGTMPSPNCAFFRKLGLTQAENVSLPPHGPIQAGFGEKNNKVANGESQFKETAESNRKKKFGLFLELLLLSEIRKQLSGVVAARYDKSIWSSFDDDEGGSVLSDSSVGIGAEQEFALSSRILRPLLIWCRVMEIGVVNDLSPKFKDVSPSVTSPSFALNTSKIEIDGSAADTPFIGGDGAIRKMIQPGSGVEFRTLRLGDGGESAMVVLFEKKEAVSWLVNNGYEKTEKAALKSLRVMEINRVIEPINLQILLPGVNQNPSNQGDVQNIASNTEVEGTRYRLVDPWEVEPLYSREAETRGASIGRNRFLAFSLGRVASSCEDIFRSIGGVSLLELWASARGGVSLTKAMATVLPSWERAAGGDLQLQDGMVAEATAYMNSIRQHLYRNALYRRLHLPQRFLALLQVELLDLKNLTSPGGSLSFTAYSLLRLKRSRSSSPLTNKARTLDSVSTSPMKLGKSSGPNAPASWGSLVRFRFPLPEQTTADGRSHDGDREALFKGPPSVLQVSVYEKKFMSDSLLGGADIKLDGLSAGGQLEEWVPLRTGNHGINWFARIRLTLRFELMCLAPNDESMDSFDELAPSVCLRRIHQLSNIGGAEEDIKKSASTPDLLAYFESMVY
jgi:hypothetical protein